MAKNTTIPHWADEIAENIITSGQHKPYWVDDMKTPSGVIHVGSLKGVMVHELVARALKNRGQDLEYSYVFNDMDPMDKRPGYIDESYDQQLGKPFYMIPAPDGVSESYARQFAQEFIEVMHYLGCYPQILWSSQLYASGQMNQVIIDALNNVTLVRKAYLEIANQEKPTDWYPFQPICPQCGKVGSTLVTDWDGDQVTFSCEPEMTAWAKGCSYQGKVSPLNGTGKLMWKVDWPAHWKAIGITIEGEGKDHSSDGGSRDIANRLIREVYHTEPPYDIPYEWFLINGKKMSTSKGVGTSAQDFANIVPSEIGRFVFVKNHFNRQINFDPSGDTLLDLFDAYDESAKEYWKKDGNDRLSRMFVLSQVDQDKIPEEQFLPRFRDVAKYIQDPKIDIVQQFTQIKTAALTPGELETLEQRKKYAQMWLERFAPKEEVIQVVSEASESAQTLKPEQKEFLKQVGQLLDQSWPDPQLLQQEIFELAKKSVGPKAGFKAIYQVLIGKDFGPKAAWFLLEHKDLAQERFFALTDGVSQEKAVAKTTDAPNLTSAYLSLDPAFAQQYPSASVGWAIIEGVSVEETNPQLEQEKEDVLAQLKQMTLESINQYPEVISYRDMYKQMRVKYQSRRPSPEALLRRIAQGKGLYRVNTLVDAYNLVVIQNRISVGAFDLNAIAFPTLLKIADGGESILLLGDTQPTTLKKGEVSYFDQQGPYNLDYNYRDAQRTCVSLATKDIWINVDGIGQITPAQVQSTLDQTIAIIQKYCGGIVKDKGVIKAG